MMEKSEWEEIGVLSKKIRNDLIELRKKSANMKMRKKEINAIMKTIDYLDKYRSLGENFMFSQGVTDINIFFGSGDKK